MAGQCGEFVRRGDKRQAGEGGQFGGDGFTETVGRIQPGADRCAALGQLADRGQCAADGPLGVIELRDEGRDFLTEADRCRIHHVGAAGLDQLHMASSQLGQAAGQFADRRQQVLLHRLHGRDVHGSGETVVGTLGAIDVIVGVHGGLAATGVASQLVGATGDHFVDVHVALGATAGLPDHQRKLVIMVAGEHLVGGLLDQTGDIGGQVAVAIIDPRRGFLDQRQGM
ncbi:hypothetical protein D3C73_1134680 [compost metagenome]